jgi:hypothetical protein
MITDIYGNLCINKLVGKMVYNDLASFYVKDVVEKGLDWWVIMDDDKPYNIINESDPMKSCVEQGNYICLASSCSLMDNVK